MWLLKVNAYSGHWEFERQKIIKVYCVPAQIIDIRSKHLQED